MSYEEKGVWLLLVIAVAGYATYLGLVLSQGVPPAQSDYVPAMLWTIGGAIVAGIVLRIVVEMFAPSESNRKDVRDRSIERFGDSVGNAFLVIGGVGALLLAVFAAPHFWIANLLYLCFVLSAVLGSVAKIVAYRRGFQPW